MKPKESDLHERFLLRERPNYISMTPEYIARLSVGDRQLFKLKLQKTIIRYALRNKPY
jgi:hypothetical protein